MKVWLLVLGFWLWALAGFGQCATMTNVRPGELDTCFKAGAIGYPEGLTFMNDGAMLWGGRPAGGVMRCNPDGSPDTTLHLGTGPDDVTHDLIVTPNRKIILGGRFRLFNGRPNPNIVKLNWSGYLDTSFNARKISFGEIWNLEAQQNGKILVTSTYNSAVRPNYNKTITRIDTNGNIDSSFSVSNLSIRVNYTRILSNNRTKLVGSCYPQPCKTQIVVDSNGVEDTTYREEQFVFRDTSLVGAKTLHVYADGKRLVSKMYVSGPAPIGTIRVILYKVRPDGIKDGSLMSDSFGGFLYSVGVDPYAHLEVRVQPDGKLLAYGGFTTYGDSISRCLVRLNADATMDTSFHVGSGFEYGVNCLASDVQGIHIRADSSMIAYGCFAIYQGRRHFGFARIYLKPFYLTGQKSAINKGHSLLPTPNPTSQTFTLQNLAQPTPLTLRDATGRAVLHTTARPIVAINVRGLPKGLYHWQAGQARGRLVVE